MTSDFESPACDACGRRDALPVWPPGSWPPPVPPQIGFVRCAGCSLVYQTPRPSPESIGQYYPPDYQPFRPAVQDERWAILRRMRGRKLAARRELVERFRDPAAPPGRVLDVGSSTGLFLDEMARAGWEAQGVEPSPTAADYARRRFGLEVFTGMVEEAPLPDGAFDVVTFWDVLEHVHSPTEALAICRRLLRPGGIVLIHVPNWDSPERRVFGRFWAGWDPPRHLYVFDKASLRGFVERAGFRPLGRVCFAPAYFTWILSLDNALAARRPGLRGPIMRLLRLPGLRLLFEPLSWALNRSGRGSVVALIARKAD